MCGRFSRARDAQTYVAPILGDGHVEKSAFRRTWNAAPGSAQPVVYREGLRTVRWGFCATFAGKPRPMLSSCGLDGKNVATLKTLWRTARVLVPADGWYEWLNEQGRNQPYFVRPIDDRPIYLAALSSVLTDECPQDADGFVIVRSSTESGVVNRISHRPFVLDASAAVRWFDSKATFGAAQNMVKELIMPRQLFRWSRVSVGVNRISNDEPAFNDPLPDDMTA